VPRRADPKPVLLAASEAPSVLPGRAFAGGLLFSVENSRPTGKFRLFGKRTANATARGRRYPAGAISGAASSAGLEVGALARLVN
jgi:hypothetical protein